MLPLLKSVNAFIMQLPQEPEQMHSMMEADGRVEVSTKLSICSGFSFHLFWLTGVHFCTNQVLSRENKETAGQPCLRRDGSPCKNTKEALFQKQKQHICCTKIRGNVFCCNVITRITFDCHTRQDITKKLVSNHRCGAEGAGSIPERGVWVNRRSAGTRAIQVKPGMAWGHPFFLSKSVSQKCLFSIT